MNDISLSTLLGDEMGIVSSPESYFSNSADDDLEDLMTPDAIKKESMFPMHDDFVSSFLTGNLCSEFESSEKKRHREKTKGETSGDSDEKQSNDPKKQQRLIKNRESAQASRERKKMYLKDLEKNVTDLQTNNKNLNSKLNALEDENNRLREQLIRASKGEKITELPAPKKQKPNVVQKIPLPSYNQMQFLHPNYWVQMFQGSGNGQSQGTGPKVVLFVALFCVALFLVKSPEKDLDVAHERVGRILQGMQTNSDLQVNPDMKSVQRLFETLKSGDQMDDRLKETLGNIKIRWNKESEQVTFIFPSSVRIQDGPGGEISISKKLLGEICEQMNHVHTD